MSPAVQRVSGMPHPHLSILTQTLKEKSPTSSERAAQHQQSDGANCGGMDAPPAKWPRPSPAISLHFIIRHHVVFTQDWPACWISLPLLHMRRASSPSLPKLLENQNAGEPKTWRNNYTSVSNDQNKGHPRSLQIRRDIENGGEVAQK